MACQVCCKSAVRAGFKITSDNQQFSDLEQHAGTEFGKKRKLFHEVQTNP